MEENDKDNCIVINNEFLERHTGLKSERKLFCQYLGLSNTEMPNSLSFLDDSKYLSQLVNNENIVAFLTTMDYVEYMIGKTVITCDDPRYYFYFLYNILAKQKVNKSENIISRKASISNRAILASYNIKIGDNSVVEPGVVIMPDVEIGNNCIIRAGTVLGSEGFEHKRTSKGILSVIHDGKVIINDEVHIGANSSVDKGIFRRNTQIGTQTKIADLVHIGHCAHIGKRCLIAANAQILAVNMEDDVWVGPNVVLLSGQHVGKGAFITVGSVVTKDISDNQKVTGYFAIPHEIFIKNLKKSLE